MRWDLEVESQAVSAMSVQSPWPRSSTLQRRGEVGLLGLEMGVAWTLKWNRGEEGRVGPESEAGPSVYHVARQEEHLGLTQILPAPHSLALP